MWTYADWRTALRWKQHALATESIRRAGDQGIKVWKFLSLNVMNSVTEGINQPFDSGSMKAFAIQQHGRNFMDKVLDQIDEKEK